MAADRRQSLGICDDFFHAHFVKLAVDKAQTKGFVLSIPSGEIAAMMAPEVALADIFGTAKIVPATDKFIRVLETINDEYQTDSFARSSLLRGLMIQLACYLAASEASERRMVDPLKRIFTN